MENIVTNEKKKDSLWQAFLFSALVLLAGAIIWAICYKLGFFASWIALASSLVACIVYHKCYKKLDWKIWVWVIGMSCLLNTLSIFITLGTVVADETGLSFGDAFVGLFELIKTNEKVLMSLIMDVAMTIMFTIIGAGLGIKTQKRQYQNELAVSAAQEAAKAAGEEGVIEFVDYDALISKMQERVKSYIETHDKEALNNDIADFKATFVDVLSPEQVKALKAKAKLVRGEDNSSVPERALACDIILNQM